MWRRLRLGKGQFILQSWCPLHCQRVSFESNGAKESQRVLSGFEWLFDCAPSFFVNGENVQVLGEPQEFYKVLKNNISKAKRRITLSSLYLGTGQLENDLVSSIKDRILASKNFNPEFSVSFLLDHVRGSRGRTMNSKRMLLPLLHDFPDNVHIALYHTPDLRGLKRWFVPQKFNETIGVNHVKVYLTDDSFIISGANLSNDYFVNRQDRYILVKNSPVVADYFHDLVCLIQSFSLHLRSTDIPVMNTHFPAHPYKGWDRGLNFKKTASSAVENFIAKWSKKNESSETSTEGDTVLFPLLQMGSIGITQDEQVTSRIFEHAPAGSNSYLATGYFNLTEEYLRRILNSRGNYNVLCAHPLANGFYKARGIIGGIPDAFTQFAKEFYHKMNESRQLHRITLQEYLRSQWTFHVKGLWYSPPDEDLPCLTLIGSSNFGHRSLKRDLENQTVLITSNVGLRRHLRHERDHVFKYGVKVEGKTFEEQERQVPLWAQLVSGYTRSFF